MKIFSRILFYLKHKRGSIVLYFFCNLLSVLFSLVSLAMLGPFLQLLFGKEQLVLGKPEWSFSVNAILSYLKYYISQLKVAKGDVFTLAVICSIVVSAILLKNLFAYLALRVMSPLRNYVMTKLRADLFEKVLQLPIGYFTDQKKGDLMSRLSNDTSEIEWGVLSTLEGLINQPLQVIVILVALVFLSPLLSLFLIVLLPVTGLVIGRLSKSLKDQSRISQESNGLLMSIMEETLGGMRVIKAFNAEKRILGKFNVVNEDLADIRNKMNYRRDLASPVSELLGVLVLCCILLFGGILVLNNTASLTADKFITYIVFFTQIINPAKSLSSAYYNSKKGAAAIERIENIIKVPVNIVDKPDAIEMETFQHGIELKNVFFAYEDAVILKNINLTIPKGKTIALVGSSGAGKSTLADLVPRFHDVTSGEILIDGVNIKDYTIHSIRKNIGIVTQEPVLFNDTIAANIALGIEETPDITDIEQAAKAANAYNFIVQKEEGFDTNIGERGGKLSGGERQRVTIARALLKNPPILILDEATSSLDTESERLVQDAINHMMKNRTCLVIAHRLSTVRHADEIIVLSKGEIIERGNHDALMAKQGMYKKLVDMQEVK